MCPWYTDGGKTSDKNLEQQIYIKFCVKIGKSASETLALFTLSIWQPLWSSGQSSWLQNQRPRFDSRHYQKNKVVGLERGPLNLMSTTEELLDKKVAAPVYKTENTVVGICHADQVASSIHKKLAITSPTSSGCLVGIVHSWTQTMEFSFSFMLNML
jgi:hypothetical protein